MNTATDGTGAIDSFLDEVSDHIGILRGRRDLILELRSAILDRAEEIGEGEVTADSVEKALESMGDPAEVAGAYVGERSLIGPRLYRPFLFYTAIVYVAHMVMIAVASVALTRIEIFPLTILRVSPPYSVLAVLIIMVHALLLDIGLMVVIFASFARVQRTVQLPRIALRVSVRPRQALARIVLAVLVIVILNFFRDRLFTVIGPSHAFPDTTVAYPVFNAQFTGRVPLLNAFLILVVGREVLYLVFGERRSTVALDALVGLSGVALMIWLLAGPAIVGFPADAVGDAGALVTLDQLFRKSVRLIMIVFAVAFAVTAAKRVFRLVQLD